MRSGQLGRLGGAAVLGIAAAEVLIMVSPFAGFFYARLRFEPLLGLLSSRGSTAWLDGFFLNHSLISTSRLLELHRYLGLILLLVGIAGFVVSAAQVYGKKLMRRGVARGLLYRFVRHPQYLCLGLAGYGLLVSWPRFLLVGVWVTMMFLYAGLARLEEQRMEERFGEEYRRFAATRGAFLPGSPVRRLFELTLGRLRPRLLGWAAAYALCLALAFTAAFGLRAYTRASAALVWQPQDQIVVLSAWPKSEDWIDRIYRTVLLDERVRQRLDESRNELPVVATILPPRYAMTDMFYKEAPSERDRRGAIEGEGRRTLICGVDPDSTDEPVQLVFSRAEKPYKRAIGLEEALDPGIRLIPLLVVVIVPETGELARLTVPLPQNSWGPQVVMPIF